jgi:hypothetical protein
MKKIFCFLLFTSAIAARAQHQLVKIWETDTVVAIPESVLLDAKKGVMYVSLIDGGGWDADGKGGVGRLSVDGKNYEPTWITGLNAPKGLGIYGNKLYAADISNVVVVDIANGKIEKKIPVDSAQGLNDITVDSKGIVYVSDSKTGKVWRIENDVPSLYLQNLSGVNGLKAIGTDLYIGASKSFKKANANKELVTVAEVSQGIDGIEPVGNGDFILTAWMGNIFYVTPDGKSELMLDSSAQKMNTADIGYDSVHRVVYVPTFNAKKVIAYSLK